MKYTLDGVQQKAGGRPCNSVLTAESLWLSLKAKHYNLTRQNCLTCCMFFFFGVLRKHIDLYSDRKFCSFANEECQSGFV